MMDLATIGVIGVGVQAALFPYAVYREILKPAINEINRKQEATNQPYSR